MNQGDIRSLAVEIVDGIYGYTVEYSNQPGVHEGDYDRVEEILTRSLSGSDNLQVAERMIEYLKRELRRAAELPSGQVITAVDIANGYVTWRVG